MKAVILAAGKGVRMMPITETIPKVLIEVNGKPFLYYLLTLLKKAGYSDFGIVVGYKGGMVKDFLEKYGFKATLINQEEQLGTGHAVSLAKDFVNNENFIVVVGDNLWSVEDLKEFNIEDDYCYISAIKTDTPEKYGVLVAKDDFLIGIIEKPKEFVGDLINTGLYKFTPEIFTALKKTGKSPNGEYQLTDAIIVLAKENKVKVKKIKDFWKDFGKPEDIQDVEKFLKKRWKEV